ncbi:MAG: long-chain fatty acid--CoA ligase [Prevotellaceae bacterium]|jgi:long-chain acyl-CoA synthetase|nr:long-chain fatty acid--CoA ligase [Prevotellaceae bacterium]
MVTRIFDLLNLYRLDDALACKVSGKWVKYSSEEYIQFANDISCGLLAMGYKPGDKVAVITNNRPEWNFIDMGVAQIGVVSVPIYPTISLEEYQYILNHAAPRMLIVSDKLLLEKLRPLFEGSPSSIEHVYTFNVIEGANHWKEIAVAGHDRSAELMPKVREMMDSVKPDDMVTLIYTSGTTGTPKGVMLSHNNLISNFKATGARNYLTEGCRSLSFLPISHIYERGMNYHFQYKGFSIYYAENMGAIMGNIKEVQPHIFNTVPRLLERIYLGIVSKGKELKGVRKRIFNDAIDVGVRFDPRKKASLLYRIRLMIAKKLVYPKWAEVLGGNVRIIVSGGAPLQTRLSNLFHAAGIDLLEGYGLTETSPVIAVTDLRRGKPKAGTVGPPLEDLDVKLDEDGEILCKGPNIMLGYYNDPEMTARIIDKDGYFHTGDIGAFDENRFLTITDRKKEIFKLKNGKYVTPQVIENKLRESFFIDQAMVIGENEKFASALIAPDFSYLHNWCYSQGIKFSDNTELLQLPEIIECYQQEVNCVNGSLGSNEQIKRFRLVSDEWSAHTGELSPTLKLKRKRILVKYSDIIDEIYSYTRTEPAADLSR